MATVYVAQRNDHVCGSLGCGGFGRAKIFESPEKAARAVMALMEETRLLVDKNETQIVASLATGQDVSITFFDYKGGWKSEGVAVVIEIFPQELL